MSPGDQLSTSPPARVRVAQVLALVALAAALVGALGPAEKLRSTYSWPPPELPATAPERVWYTPLLLATHRAESISATVPCALSPPLRSAETPTTVLATAREPERVPGLALTQVGSRLEIAVGEQIVDRAPLGVDGLDGRECAYRLLLQDGRWWLEGGPDGVSRAGKLDVAPTVTGLFSALDLRSPGAPSIEVTTAVHTARPTTRQAVAWTTAGLAALAALLFVALPRGRPRPRRPALRAPDAAVAAFLLGWWVLAPAAFDDGWLIARQRTFEGSGGFSLYYSTFGVNLPLGYWYEWLNHWLAEETASLVVNRVPFLLCLAATWALCRFVAARTLGPSRAGDSVALWTLAAAFAIGTAAWGMTLRPEPLAALLVTGIAACMVVFLERKSTASVAIAAALVALALATHPAGIVSLAPILVALPQLLRWLRAHVPDATVIVASGIALLATLLFVGSDLERRRADAGVVRTFSSNDAWRDELFRYTLLDEHHYGTPLRRVSVLLMALAVLGYVVRRRRGGERLLDFPVWALTTGLILLIATPSKWPSHFGTLLGIAAVAVCCETARVRGETARADRWSPWPFLAAGAASLGVWWAWLSREQWNAVDLRTLDWAPGFESRLPVATLAAALPLVALAGALIIARLRGSTARHRIPWRVASWAGVLIAAPVLAFTVGMLVADTAKTNSWTLARQSLGTLVGRDPGCGLADDVLVPVADSARPVSASRRREATLPAWVPQPPVAKLPRFALGPAGGTTRGATPWFDLPAERRIGLFLTGEPRPSDRLWLEWGRRQPDGVVRLGAAPIGDDVGPMAGDTAWRFRAGGELPQPDAQANAVRVALHPGVAPGGAVAVTAPVSYETRPLADRVGATSSRTLVWPNLFTYFPCVRQPVLRNGIVEPPTHVVSFTNQSSPLSGHLTSPFEGVRDLYDLEQLSTADSEAPPRNAFAYEVKREIPGAAEAPPVTSTVAS